MLNMQLAQIALHIVIISVMTVEETCGGKTCWFHKKTRAGEECRGRMRRFTPGIARFLGGDTNSWACTRHWTRVHREVNSFCACPLPVHSTELSQRHIPVRLYQIFDRIGVTVPGYRAGVRWCNSCSKTADEKFKSERDYSPPEKVSHPVFLCHKKETHVHPPNKYLHLTFLRPFKWKQALNYHVWQLQRASYSTSQTSNSTTSSSKQVMQLNHFRGNKYTVHMFNILKLSRFQQPREQLEKQLKEMSSRNELLEAELGKANNQIQLLTGTHSKLYCQILERGRLSIETWFTIVANVEDSVECQLTFDWLCTY